MHLLNSITVEKKIKIFPYMKELGCRLRYYNFLRPHKQFLWVITSSEYPESYKC